VPRGSPQVESVTLKQEALAALNELPSIRQAIGRLGLQLRRCKPGSKRHKEIWESLTLLENQASKGSSAIRLALSTLPD